MKQGKKSKAGKKKKVAGGMMVVKIAHLAQSMRTIRIKAKSTVAEVLDAAGLTSTRGDIFINGERARLSTALKNGDILGIVGQVRGGI